MVTEDRFLSTLDQWYADVRKEAIRLFLSDVDHEHCLHIAMKIVEARDLKKARAMAQMMGVTPPRLGQPPRTS